MSFSSFPLAGKRNHSCIAYLFFFFFFWNIQSFGGVFGHFHKFYTCIGILVKLTPGHNLNYEILSVAMIC